MILCFVQENNNTLTQFGANSFTQLLMVNFKNDINSTIYSSYFLIINLCPFNYRKIFIEILQN